jgi:hypothetical protein
VQHQPVPASQFVFLACLPQDRADTSQSQLPRAPIHFPIFEVVVEEEAADQGGNQCPPSSVKWAHAMCCFVHNLCAAQIFSHVLGTNIAHTRNKLPQHMATGHKSSTQHQHIVMTNIITLSCSTQLFSCTVCFSTLMMYICRG